MAHTRIHSGGAFEAMIGYCRAVKTDDGWIHVAGTVGVDPETRKPPESVVDQCRCALDTIRDALNRAGAGFEDVVRVHYILPDKADFEPCWPLLAETFGDNPPAATMFEAGLIDPVYKIEIEVTAKTRATAQHGP
ncbi:RidA family protein [Pseudooceanicola sp. LIPI14-2-Ac024]|uniref:RidA family protein n=1 Tax=Pseudooceanicola sp. LIPI14-2-Ac024 TaxID=3344875 RepID=UPI0035CEEE68